MAKKLFCEKGQNLQRQGEMKMLLCQEMANFNVTGNKSFILVTSIFPVTGTILTTFVFGKVWNKKAVLQSQLV